MEEEKTSEPIIKKPCLRCNKVFMPEGPTNRICQKCEKKNAGGPINREAGVPDRRRRKSYLLHMKRLRKGRRDEDS